VGSSRETASVMAVVPLWLVVSLDCL